MIYSILFIDVGGALVHSWERVEMETITDKNELIPSLIKALMDFGSEVIATPQRIDFGELAMTFFPLKSQEKDLWIAAISDTKDPITATRICVNKITTEIEELLLAMNPSDGVVFENDRLTHFINEKIDVIVSQQRRRLETIRTKPFQSLLLSLPIITPIALFCNFVASYSAQIIGTLAQGLLFYVVLSALGLLYSYNGGILAGNKTGGALTGYFSTLLAGIVMFTFFTNLSFIGKMEQIAITAYIATFNGLAGWFGGKNVTLTKVFPPHRTKHLTIEQDEPQ